jgi:hypothetical protein
MWAHGRERAHGRDDDRLMARQAMTSSLIDRERSPRTNRTKVTVARLGEPLRQHGSGLDILVRGDRAFNEFSGA